jgi:sugar lactone lactonase YvrE
MLWVCATACSDAAKPQSLSPKLTRLDIVAGQPGGPGWVNGTLAAAHFSDPWAIASDGHEHLYVAEGFTVRTIDVAAGQVTTLAGVYNQPGGTDGVGAQASLNLPSGLAFDAGQLYVADTENHLLRRIDVQSGSVTTIAGSSGPGAVDGTASDASFREPEGLALDGARNLYIADTDNNTIRMLSRASGAVTTVAGTAGMAGAADGVGAAALFNKPRALTIDTSGNLYVADSSNNSVRKIATDTASVSTLVTFDSTPQGLAVDGGDLLVSLYDTRVVRVAADGTTTTVAGAAGVQGFIDGAGGDARFGSPAGLLNDGAGTLYVADNRNAAIRAIALNGPVVSTYAGVQSSGSSDGRSTQARFFAPKGLATDGSTIYVADTSNDAIRKISLATGEVTTLTGTIGQAGLFDGALADARFNQPQALALDVAAQKLYVADTLNRSIRVVDLGADSVATLTYSPTAGSTLRGFDAPSGLVLEQGQLFVTDYTDDVVVAIDLKRSQISTLAGQYGVPAGTDGVGSQAGFYGPLGIASDGRGNLYVADSFNHTIRKIEIVTAAVSTLAGEAGVRGRSDGIGAAAHFSSPNGVTANGSGDLFVTDLLNNTVRHIDTSSGAVTTVIGTASATGVLLGPLPAQLTQPSALELTPSGTLLVVSENAVLLAH